MAGKLAVDLVDHERGNDDRRLVLEIVAERQRPLNLR